MVDQDIVLQKLAFIEARVKELRTIARPERIESDIREERFITHTLQLAIQAALDTASHIVSDERLGEPRTNRELFDLLAKSHWLSADLTNALRNMAGFRNIIVHGYEDVELKIVADIINNRLTDFDDFITAIQTRLKYPEARS